MKKIFTLSALCLTVLSAQAQITLNQSDYANWTPGSSATFRGVTNFTATPAANGNWDISGATYGTDFSLLRSTLTIPGLSQVTFGDNMSYGSGTTFSYDVVIGGGITSSGYQYFGEDIQRQAIGLGLLTGDTDDSLVFNQQIAAYSAPRTVIAFPATDGSTWSSNYNYQTTFGLTVGMYSLNNAPGARRTYTERADSVKGWGTMRVLNAINTASDYMYVLAVESTIKVKDSFFLNGTPAPTPMLGALGLTQGQVENSYYTYYYRPGEIDPLLTVKYSDASRSNVTSAYAHKDRIPTGIKNVVFSNNIKVYPNPSVNGAINISAEELKTGNWTYTVSNVAGQTIAAGVVNAPGGNASLHISNAPTGVYYLNLNKNGVQQATKAISLQ